MEYPPVHMGYLCDLVTGIDCENRVLIELEVAGFRLKTARKCMEKELSYSRQMPVGEMWNLFCETNPRKVPVIVFLI